MHTIHAHTKSGAVEGGEKSNNNQPTLDQGEK